MLSSYFLEKIINTSNPNVSVEPMDSQWNLNVSTKNLSGG